MRIRSLLLFFCGFTFIFYGHLKAEPEFQFVSFADYYGGIEQSEGYENLRARLFFSPRCFGTIDKFDTDYVVSATLWGQPIGSPGFIDAYDIPNEVYLSKSSARFDLSVGQKLITYGFADVYGPLNAPHSSYSDILSLDDQFEGRRPDPLIQLRFYPTTDDCIELTYIPITRPDKERDDNVYLHKTMDTVIWNDDPYLVNNLHSIFINYSRYAQKFDLQLLYGWYTEHTPDFKIDTIDDSIATDIDVVYNRKQTFGAAYATRLGSATLSQDFAFNLTSDFSGTDIGAQDSDITVNTQILVNLPWNILSQHSIVYAYFFNHDKYDTGSDKVAANALAEEIHDFHIQPYQHILFYVGHFERSFLREKLKAQLNVGFFFSPNIYVAPRLSYSITDRSRWEAGIDYTFGDPPNIDLRRNPSNDNFFTRFVMQY